MGNKRREAECPFPNLCALHGDKGCSVKRSKPIIVCSMAELCPEKVAFDEKAICEYLDRHIGVWELKKQCTESEFAKFYVDAYQKLRKDLFGEGLNGENK